MVRGLGKEVLLPAKLSAVVPQPGGLAAWATGEREIEIDVINYDTYHGLGYGKGGERSML